MALHTGCAVVQIKDFAIFTLEKSMLSDVLAVTRDPKKVGVPSTVLTIGLRICPPRSNSCAEILRTGVFAPELVLELEPENQRRN